MAGRSGFSAARTEGAGADHLKALARCTAFAIRMARKLRASNGAEAIYAVLTMPSAAPRSGPNPSVQPDALRARGKIAQSEWTLTPPLMRDRVRDRASRVSVTMIGVPSVEREQRHSGSAGRLRIEPVRLRADRRRRRSAAAEDRKACSVIIG